MASATLKDVAKYANVSQATVSRVLNGHPTVDEAMRDRVHAAILALGYQPNRAARRLRAQSSTVIGLIIPDVENPFFLSIIRGIEDATYAHSMNVILCNSDEDVDKQSMYLDVMRAERVAGLILVASPGTTSAKLNNLIQSGIPLIFLDRFLDGVSADLVKADNVSGAYNAVNHMLGLGYRRIAIIVHTSQVSTGPERYEGYVKALQNAGISYDPDLVKYGDFSLESAYQTTRELLSLPKPPDAIFAANNLMSMGALRVLRELGKRVPEDIAIIGFDNLPWLSEFASPLTVVSQPSYELGQEAVALLLRRIAQPSAPARAVILQTTLIIRESCGSGLVANKKSKPPA